MVSAEIRYVLSTKVLKSSTITWWGKRRWQISLAGLRQLNIDEGLHRFGQETLLGVYRWLVLSLIAYLLAHWAYLSTESTNLPDWGQAAQLARLCSLTSVSIVSTNVRNSASTSIGTH